MIVQPESRLLLTDQSVKPSASVFVELSAPRLEPESVNAIRNLVANAVQGLAIDQVAVVDNHGRVLSEELRQDPMLSTASSQMRYRQQIEDYFAHKVESMLAPVVGSGNAVVRVSAEIETEATTRTEEKFDPDGQVVRSQTITEDASTTTESRNGGVVGVSANVPEKMSGADTARPTANTEQNRKNRSTSYEINHSTTNTVRNPGSIKSLSAAVFIAQRPAPAGAPGAAPAAPEKRTPEELNSLRQIVANALGLKLDPGQPLEAVVSLQEMSFQTEPVAQQVRQIQRETRVNTWLETASRYVSVAVAAIVLLVFWRMLRKQRPEPVPLDLLDTAQIERRSLPAPGQVTPEMLNELIRRKPANIGIALRDWVAPKKVG
jgi:flagellar M-ring protein FliF